MKTTIFYYTATGNALTIARSIASGIGDAELVPIAKYRQARIAPSTDRVGIVFPIYAWGAPRTVEEFIENLDLQAARYVFAIATCGGTAANTLPRLKKALRKKGGRLDAAFIVRSPGYMESADAEPGMIAMVRRLSGKLFPTDAERLPRIIEMVRDEKSGPIERNALPGALLGSFFHGKAVPSFAKLDAMYRVADTCVGCGTCARVCPRANVKLDTEKPVWQHDCDNCGACATWCPRNAIGFEGAPAAPRRHNPAVAASDLMWS